MDHDDSSQDELLDSSVLTVLPEQRQTPRLRIHHLMLWMLCSAPLLTFLKGYSEQDTQPQEYEAIVDVGSLLHGIVGGAMIAGSMVLVGARLREGTRLLRQPGHWLLFVSALAHTAGIFLAIVLEGQSEDLALSMILYSGLQLIPGLAFLLAARDTAMTRWRAYFIGLFLASLLQCTLYLLIAMTSSSMFGLGAIGWEWYSFVSIAVTLSEILCALWLVIVVIIDMRLKMQRDWLHWTGILCFLSLYGLSWLWQLSFWLLTQLQ